MKWNLDELTEDERAEADRITRETIGRTLDRCDALDIAEVRRRLHERVVLLQHEREFAVDNLLRIIEQNG